MTQKKEEYLYHYTRIDTLALILKNKTIRFNSLDKMDDLQEMETEDAKNIGQFCYVSSWTDDENESINMWDRYASKEFGVRIRLKKNPFKLYDNDSKYIQEKYGIQVQEKLKTYIPIVDFLEKNFYCTEAITKNILHQVEYTDSQEKLFPKIIKENTEQCFIEFEKLGKNKNTFWEFQKEWRYIMNILPMKIDDINQSLETIKQIRAGKEEQAVPYYDLIISDEAFSEMEITLCPNIEAGNYIIVQDLVEKYNPNAKVYSSKLEGLISNDR